ncbi:MAG TPA: DUF6600 domain-containing protein [Candidatus Krumholzibacteria bacterium]
MRHTVTPIILAALFVAAGCSSYDRELMGDPEPREPAQQVATQAEAAPETEDSLGVGQFNELRYYGQWYWVDPYGWVWRPSVVTGWQPFVNGHWIWSQYGWTWIDYDPWGWATSHYGYWTTDYTMGWIWIPDYQWSPAQVDWMLWEDYACWSPVPPPGSHWRDPWDDTAWVSIPVRRFKEQNIRDYRTTPKYKAGESEQTLIRTAPDLREIEKHGPKFGVVDVTLDRRVIGEREFAKIKLPADQDQIIRSQQPVTSGSFQPVRAPAPPVNDDGTSAAPSNPQPERVKSKNTGNSNNSGSSSAKKETRYKEKKAEERSKDSGKSKTETKSGKKGGK